MTKRRPLRRTAIEWTDYSWNPIRARERNTGKIGWHCEHASEECCLCYAETINKRVGTRLALTRPQPVRGRGVSRRSLDRGAEAARARENLRL